MKKKQGATNLILVGKWNKYILSPNWLSKEIFKKEEIQVEFSFSLDLPPRFTCDNVRIIPDEDKVIFIALEYNRDTLTKIEEMACRLAELLPVTPVVAVGINFGYEEDVGSSDLVGLFELNDNNNLIDYNVEIENYFIRRKILIEGQILNLSIRQDKEKVIFDFNFHYDTPTTDEIKKIIPNRFVENKRIAEDLLKNVYHLEFED